MFLHIGKNITIQKKDIVAIIDKKTADKSQDTKMFIGNMIRDGFLYNDNIDNIKTYIITCVEKIDRKNRKCTRKYTLYTSSISSTTLSNRKEINI
ncbi:TPA: hypothetical protein ACG3RW_003861 [Clostridioides difficile]|jgi:hypothetical protein